MSKIQKIWMWIFIAMFIIPEALFFTTPLLIESLLGKSFLKLSSLLLNYGVFFTHPFYLLAIILIEWVGALGLLIIAVKFGKNILVIIPLIIMLWLLFIFCVVYITGVSMR